MRTKRSFLMQFANNLQDLYYSHPWTIEQNLSVQKKPQHKVEALQ